jgi:site-specific recombinase XerC
MTAFRISGHSPGWPGGVENRHATVADVGAHPFVLWPSRPLENNHGNSEFDRADHLSTRPYARLVAEWVTGVGLRREEYGTHSLRQTKASIIYKATGNLRAVQILLGHTKIGNTVRYLGVDVEDALTLAEGTEI